MSGPRCWRHLGLPAVTLNRPTVPSAAPAVCMDDRPAVRDAMEHLVGLGHRRIGHVGGPSRYLHAVERRQVWADVLRQHGLSETLWVEADFSAAGGAAATRQLLDSRMPPTAILYASDLMAVAGFAIAHQRGLRIPHDSVRRRVFDDGELSEHLSTPLATVRTDAYGWGRAAATALQTCIKGEAVPGPTPARRPIHQRESTGPVPQHDNQLPATTAEPTGPHRTASASRCAPPDHVQTAGCPPPTAPPPAPRCAHRPIATRNHLRRRCSRPTQKDCR